MNNDGARVIPASRRPDGTIRKERKIREGYVAPEEIPKYAHPNAFPPEPPLIERQIYALGTIQDEQKSKSARKNEKRAQKRREKQWTGGPEDTGDHVEDKADVQPVETPKIQTETPTVTIIEDEEEKRKKQLKSLQKKLRQVELLKQAQQEGKPLDIDQQEKISKEQEFIDAMNLLKLK